MPGFVSTGTTVTIAGFTAEIVDITGPSMSSVAVDTSHQLSDTWRSFVNGKLTDGGEITLDTNFEPTQGLPPTGVLIADVVIDWAGTGASATWTFDGIVTGFDITAPLEDRMSATLTIKVAGAIVVT